MLLGVPTLKKDSFGLHQGFGGWKDAFSLLGFLGRLKGGCRGSFRDSLKGYKGSITGFRV